MIQDFSHVIMVSVLPSCSPNMVSYTDAQGEPDVHTRAQFFCGSVRRVSSSSCKASGMWGRTLGKNH